MKVHPAASLSDILCGKEPQRRARKMNEASIQQAYALARERYAEIGVDCRTALDTLRSIAISLHCWQGDDVGGFESAAGLTGGGIQATGNYPGKARNIG